MLSAGEKPSPLRWRLELKPRQPSERLGSTTAQVHPVLTSPTLALSGCQGLTSAPSAAWSRLQWHSTLLGPRWRKVHMRRHLRRGALGGSLALLAFACLVRLHGHQQTSPPANSSTISKLPLTSAILYSSGVGYFE